MTEKPPHVVQCAVGQKHGVLLTDEGIVYTWGSSNTSGELGRSPPSPEAEKKPSPITDSTFRNEIIVSIAAGWKHSLALTMEGKLYAWGENKAGQLGIIVEDFISAQKTSLLSKVPTIVWKFNASDKKLLVKSCSCGPESSACVTMDGEIYVWGATSFYLFGNGKHYSKVETCTIPVPLRNVPILPKDPTNGIPWIAGQCSVYGDRIVCTTTDKDVEDELNGQKESLKARNNTLTMMNRPSDEKKQEKSAVELPDMINQIQDFRTCSSDSAKRMQKIDTELAEIGVELARINRELTIFDQNDTANMVKSDALETKKGGGRTGAEIRKVDAELNDIGHFRASNKEAKMKSFKERDKYEKKQEELKVERLSLLQLKSDADIRARLLQALLDHELGVGGDSTIDAGLNITLSKHRELQATRLSILADRDSFTGFRECLEISNVALRDVSSALKEVSATVSGLDGATLEESLEFNLGIRKELNQLIKETLQSAEDGQEGESNGMMLYHKEAQMALKNPRNRKSHRSTSRRSNFNF